MIESLPFYVIIVFILTTLLTVGIFQNITRRGSFSSKTTTFLNFIIAFWLIFQGTISILGFYQKTDIFPPRLFVFAVLPSVLLIVGLFIFSRDWIEKLPLKTLTLLSIVRIPVEIVLLWLFQNGQVPQLMTFEGRNFDILSGLTAPIVAYLAFRNGRTNRLLLIVWNLVCLILLINIVSNAALSLPSPIQQLGFDQPNRGVLFFPFIWLPSTIVPIVLFSHLVSLWQLFTNKIKV
ncbi:MAG TPA: hypothetical protein PKY82_21090 [Pyrinomonadaceae bacterium]|nr:hypothetical protein [Pyrinomonadaceae bacterium]